MPSRQISVNLIPIRGSIERLVGWTFRLNIAVNTKRDAILYSPVRPPHSSLISRLKNDVESTCRVQVMRYPPKHFMHRDAKRKLGCVLSSMKSSSVFVLVSPQISSNARIKRHLFLTNFPIAFDDTLSNLFCKKRWYRIPDLSSYINFIPCKHKIHWETLE